MQEPEQSRYEHVSRRAVLRASLAAGTFALVPGLACGNRDEEVFAGARTELAPSTTSSTTTSSTTTSSTLPSEPQTPKSTSQDETLATSGMAVSGEMVISFTYTFGPEGKITPPYIAVWIEDAAGELAQTVSLWYEQGRKGARWLDHLSRWYPADLDRIATGGASNIGTISSATRQPGTYAVVWDGAIDGVSAGAGDYFVCIEAVREDGPLSLIREPFFLDGSLAETMLPDVGELSMASVRIDG